MSETAPSTPVEVIEGPSPWLPYEVPGVPVEPHASEYEPDHVLAAQDLEGHNDSQPPEGRLGPDAFSPRAVLRYAAPQSAELSDESDESADGEDNPHNGELEVPEETEEVVVAAHEVLGNSKLLKIAVFNSASHVLNTITYSKAVGKNAASTPKLAALTVRVSAAQKKYDRKAAKQNTSVFKFRNRHHDKVAHKAQTTLHERTRSYDQQADKMQAREHAATQKSYERRQAVDLLRSSLVEQKVIAQEQKVLRKAQRKRKHAAALLGGSESEWSRKRRQQALRSLGTAEKAVVREQAVAILKAKKQKKGRGES